MKSLKVLNNPLSEPEIQMQMLDEALLNAGMPNFQDRIRSAGYTSIQPSHLEILQINVGKMCNQVCKHCHVDAGPDRKEIMTWSTMQDCLKALEKNHFNVVDITGGAPEMNPNFRPFIELIRAQHPEIEIIVRCNLTIILANKKYFDLPQFFRTNRITIVSSLPYYEAGKTDRQRGDGVFEKSIQALQMLNEVGYGKADSLKLNLVYNPAGAFLPGDQSQLEERFKQVLFDKYNIVFNALYAITNLPVSRFLDYLFTSGNLQAYMEKLIGAFNPATISGLMCRNTISVGWDGTLYDCDFNQMLDMPVDLPERTHIQHFDAWLLAKRHIATASHCYGCTAGSGSSCGGATV